MAGSFLGSFLNTVNADQFEFSFSIFVLAMIILGGLGSIWGVVVGALTLSFINTRLIPDVLNTVPSKIGLDFDLTQLGFGIFGFLLVIMMVLRPQGLIPEKRHKAELTEGAGRRRVEARGGARMSTRRDHAERDAGRRTATAILETEGLTKHFGGLTAVDGVSFACRSARSSRSSGRTAPARRRSSTCSPACTSRRSGASSSTARTSPTRRPDQITRAGVARTFQNIRLFGTMSAVENVLVGRHARMKAGLRLDPAHAADAARGARGREKARELLEYVGVDQRRFDDAASYLSYGDQRRVEIARALASDPKLLLLDEPTAGMNPQESEQLTGFMRKLRDELELAILLIEHDMKVVMGVSEQVTVLDHGEKIAEGEPRRCGTTRRSSRPTSGSRAERWRRCSRSRTSTRPTARSRRSRASR